MTPLETLKGFKQHLDKTIVGLENSKLAICTLISTMGWICATENKVTYPLNGLIMGDLSIGKTHLIKTTAEYFGLPYVSIDTSTVSVEGAQGGTTLYNRLHSTKKFAGPAVIHLTGLEHCIEERQDSNQSWLLSKENELLELLDRTGRYTDCNTWIVLGSLEPPKDFNSIKTSTPRNMLEAISFSKKILNCFQTITYEKNNNEELVLKTLEDENSLCGLYRKTMIFLDQDFIITPEIKEYCKLVAKTEGIEAVPKHLFNIVAHRMSRSLK